MQIFVNKDVCEFKHFNAIVKIIGVPNPIE